MFEERIPVLEFLGLKASKRGRLEKSSPPSFSNHPFLWFEKSPPRRLLGHFGLKKGAIKGVWPQWPNGSSVGLDQRVYRVRVPLQTPYFSNHLFLSFQGRKFQKRGWFEKSSPPSFSNHPFLEFLGLEISKRAWFEKSVRSKPLVGQQDPCNGIF